jgi:hypothetical protein
MNAVLIPYPHNPENILTATMKAVQQHRDLARIQCYCACQL